MENLDEKRINGITVDEALTVIHEKYSYIRLTNFDYSINEGALLTEEQLNEQQQLNEQEWLDSVQTVLDYAGIVPVVGDAIDLINGIIYFTRAGVEGKFMPNGLNGLLSMIAVIPVVGSAISIPVKALFKIVPITAAATTIKKILNGGDAAGMITKMAGKNSKVANILNPLRILITKNLDVILKGTKGLKWAIKKIAIIPFTKIDDVLSVAGVKLITSLEKFLVGLGKSSGKTASKGVVKKLLSVPTNMLTKRGRIALSKSIIKPGKKRMFYASQDMFGDFLMKEGKSIMTTTSSNKLLKNALTNIGAPAMKAGEKLPSFLKRTGLEKKVIREFTNLTIVNNPKIFNDFIKSAGATTRFKTFIRTVDPSIVRDANTFWSGLRKVGVKSMLLMGKTKPSGEDYQNDRELNNTEKGNKDTILKDKIKTGKSYGKKRNV